MTVSITTFSRDGYELYGHRMIESWLKFWPKTHRLVVYTEDFELTESDIRLTSIDLNSACPALVEFKKRSQAMIDNATDDREISRVQKTVKWSHKVFAIAHALNNAKTQRLIFLDGDTYTVSPIEHKIAEMLVDTHLLAVHFEMLPKHGLHFETGLLVFNNTHPQMPLFRKIYTEGYETMDIYKMRKTWDTFWLVNLYQKHNLDIFDLSEGKRGGVFGNPLVRGKLRHEVGTRKYQIAGYNKFTGKKQ